MKGFVRIVLMIALGVSNHLIFSGCTWMSIDAKTASTTVVISSNALDQTSDMAIVIQINTANGCLIDMAGKLAIKFG